MRCTMVIILLGLIGFCLAEKIETKNVVDLAQIKLRLEALEKQIPALNDAIQSQAAELKRRKIEFSVFKNNVTKFMEVVANALGYLKKEALNRKRQQSS
ncbi:unnamed protein product [Caenorhabditis auriculariae]|uniref:SXP/RAL-2 family protein Ani s 5-like cation-binding domain-containing protein n=1 Tax=Caenorhabditis auriculariae TaxID=2777116 RepID=A0A8S1H051_9PELO|nr:unnamed protein product [Caenorhabditis auriculariae]